MIIVALIIAGLVITGLAVMVLFLRRSSDNIAKPVDYRFFYWMGIMLLPVGIVFFAASLVIDFSSVIGIVFIAIGTTYIVIGLANRKKWQKRS